MKLSVKVDYACRVLAQIARLYGTAELAHVETLAKAEAVPANFLAQILSELRDGGLITSRRGKQGGYALARPPEEISLYDIVTLVEGVEPSDALREELAKHVRKQIGAIAVPDKLQFAPALPKTRPYRA